MIEPVSRTEVKNSLYDEIKNMNQAIKTSPCTPQSSTKLVNGVKFHPDIAFWSILATVAVAVITELGTNNPEYATIAAILTAAVTSGIQKYEQINSEK